MQRSLIPPPPAHARHIFCCVEGSCIETMEAERFLLKFTEVCRGRGLLDHGNPLQLRINRSGCLGICIGGPILVVYPEGIWYALVDDEGINRIVDEHLLRGKVVEEYLLHRLYPTGAEPLPPGLERNTDPLLEAAEKAAAEKAAERSSENEPLPEHVRAARERRRRRKRF